MNVFDLFKRTPAKEESSGGLPPHIVNMLKDRDTREKVKKVVIDLVEQTKLLTRQDIASWRSAWQRAISVEHPSRVPLNAVFRDVEIDNHLMGVVGQIKKDILQKDYLIVDRNSEKEIEGLAKTFDDAQWFLDFCEYAIDSELHGFRLVQFGDLVQMNGIWKYRELELVDPDHVIPEHEVFVANKGDHFSNGQKYTEPPYDRVCIGIGRKKSLGLYNAVAKEAIAKKNMMAFWDKFGEIFGMPMRIGKTGSANPKDRNDVVDMLKKMGSAAWGLFPDGTEIEIKETTRGDAYEVYDRRIERANSEMSKAIVHQTMTTDNGSSRSQSEVHLSVQEKVIDYFARRVRIIINDQLIPFMIADGFKGWENAKLIWDNTVEYTVQEQINIETMVFNNFDVEPEYIREKYNIPVVAKKKPETPAGGFFD